MFCFRFSAQTIDYVFCFRFSAQTIDYVFCFRFSAQTIELYTLQIKRQRIFILNSNEPS